MFKDQGVETGRFRVKMGVFKDQGVETGRFRGEDGVFKDQGVETGRFRVKMGVCLRIRGWRRVVFRGEDGCV